MNIMLVNMLKEYMNIMYYRNIKLANDMIMILKIKYHLK